jgi:hypothetical protein
VKTDAELDAAADVLMEIANEYGRASCKFPPFASEHEGYAILLEELDEAWAEIKANDTDRALEEMVQVGAMAVRFIIDIRAKQAGAA